ncbi:MAG: hypothetical protein A2Z71_04515 [Chloroflexi bacterium RBG_13_50_21]|nr:MAG: hypothetical protein A2Z71_04515 [Chloroflexi bacterium RBG_13_50_21]
MIRIGFDPVLEAEQLHRDLIKEVEGYRIANQGLAKIQNHAHRNIKILALIGKGISSLGATLEARYSDSVNTELSLSSNSDPHGCSS